MKIPYLIPLAFTTCSSFAYVMSILNECTNNCEIDLITQGVLLTGFASYCTLLFHDYDALLSC
jgi:hypothetical protein